MTTKAGYSTPMLHVADVERSLRFYERLGFEVVDVESGEGVMGWARMHCEGGAVMFLRSEEPHADTQDRFLLYLYAPDLPALCTELAAAGVEVGAIGYPAYMPSGEACLHDPDGYTILIAHWSDREHAEWLKSLKRKREAGLLP
jgi:catechol 2,3-dioxygenase-like lactoylglutathione lyase family enzyme